MKILRTVSIGAALALTSACSDVYTHGLGGNVSVLSSEAKHQLAFTTNRDGRQIVCATPSPDAIQADAFSLAGKAGVTLSSGDDVKAQLGFGRSETAAFVAMRTQTIQLLRDVAYRICESYLNGAIDDGEYQTTIRALPIVFATTMAIDGVTTAAVAPSIAISSGNVKLASQDDGDGDGNSAQPPQGSNPQAALKAATESAAIANGAKDVILRAMELAYCASNTVGNTYVIPVATKSSTLPDGTRVIEKTPQTGIDLRAASCANHAPYQVKTGAK